MGLARENACMTTQRSTLNDNDTDTVVLRLAREDDTIELRRLARLDSALPLGGEVLVAVRDGQIGAAISLHSERVIADPFAPTADLVGLLRTRVELLRDAPAGSSGHRLARRLLRAVA